MADGYGKLYQDSPNFVDAPDELPGLIQDVADLNAQNQMLYSIRTGTQLNSNSFLKFPQPTAVPLGQRKPLYIYKNVYPVKKVEDFDPIAADYAFFETHATEAEQDVKAVHRHAKVWRTGTQALHFLDFGCGTGTFTERFLEALQLDPGRLHLHLVEPGPDNLKKAVECLAAFSSHPVQAGPTLPVDLPQNFNLVLANHVLYYVPDLTATLSTFAGCLAPGGRLIINMAGRDNALIRFWEAGFSAIGTSIPYRIAEDVETAMAGIGLVFEKETIPYSIRFEDKAVNRLRIMRFLFGPQLHGIPEDFLLGLFDTHIIGSQVQIETAHSMYIIKDASH